MTKRLRLRVASLAKAGERCGEALSLCMALEAAGMGARLVGGCVRDLLLDKVPKDFDIACTSPPERTRDFFVAIGYKVVELGMNHGTVGVYTGRQLVEITTLRRDLETDGRRARVSYTEDFAQDASRRDFTINALYLDSEGYVWDYVGGLEDLRARRLVFVGEAVQRIREDYLRSLRYFRFLSRLGWRADPEALAAIASERGGLVRLSQERVFAEMEGLLCGKHPDRILALMKEAGLLRMLFPWFDESQTARVCQAIRSWGGSRPDASWFAMFWLGALQPWTLRALEDEMRRLRFDRTRIRNFASLLRLASRPASQPEFWREGLDLIERGEEDWFEILEKLAPSADKPAFQRLAHLARNRPRQPMPAIPFPCLEKVPPKCRADALAIVRLYFFSLGLEDLALLQRIILEPSPAWQHFLEGHPESFKTKEVDHAVVET